MQVVSLRTIGRRRLAQGKTDLAYIDTAPDATSIPIILVHRGAPGDRPRQHAPGRPCGRPLGRLLHANTLQTKRGTRPKAGFREGFVVTGGGRQELARITQVNSTGPVAGYTGDLADDARPCPAIG